MSDSFTLFIALLYLVVALVLVFWRFIQRYLDKKYYLALSDSKDFKIDDPVVYNDHGDDYFTHINGVYSWEEKLCYSLEAVEFVVWSSKLRHPTPEELEKYFRK